jgi:hypothetical protein
MKLPTSREIDGSDERFEMGGIRMEHTSGNGRPQDDSLAKIDIFPIIARR